MHSGPSLVFSDTVKLYEQKLHETAQQLERWAEESRKGGWSTHQVDPMLRKANEIYSLIGRQA